MRRPAFSLVELIIATSLASLVIIAFYGVIDQSRQAQKSVNNQLIKTEDGAMLYQILSKDIIPSTSLGYKENLMVLSTPHTLHYRFSGNVIYVLNTKNHQLLRVESRLAHEIDKDFNSELLDDMSVDLILDEVDTFEVSADETLQKVIVAIGHKGEQRLFGFSRFVTTSTQSSNTTEESTTQSTSETEEVSSSSNSRTVEATDSALGASSALGNLK
jgi:hypothetical protein